MTIDHLKWHEGAQENSLLSISKINLAFSKHPFGILAYVNAVGLRVRRSHDPTVYAR